MSKEKELLLLNKETRQELIELSSYYTLAYLSQYGNIPTVEHGAALRKIIKGFVHLLDHKRKLAYPLPCGSGKTLSICGFLKALHILNLNYSLVITANQVEDLCRLKRALLSNDISPEKIGLIHSKESASILSDTIEQASQRPFVLVAHNKIKHPDTQLESYFYYKGQKRDLVIWDESLIAGQSTRLSVKTLRKLINDAIVEFDHEALTSEETAQAEPLLSYLRTLEEKLAEVHQSKERDIEISFERPQGEWGRIKDQLNYFLGNQGEELCQLLEAIRDHKHIRYLKEQNGSLVYFEPMLPDELESIAVLDASHSLRELTKSDRSIKTVKLNYSKNYENLKIHCYKGRSGREFWESEFRNSRKSKAVREIIGILCSILEQHPGEPLVLWTYKENNGINIIEHIKEELRLIYPESDFDEEISEGKKLINFMTFGNELGLNTLTHCKHSVFCGVLCQPTAPLAMSLKGLTGEMERDVYEDNLLYRTKLTEQAHVLYQAISRGSSRETREGECLEHQVYFSHYQSDQIRALLEEMFPKAQWYQYETKYIEKTTSISYQRGLEVDAMLSSLPEEKFRGMCGVNSKSYNRISTRKVKKILFPHYTDTEWKVIIRDFNKYNYPGWKQEDRSLVRKDMH